MRPLALCVLLVPLWAVPLPDTSAAPTSVSAYTRFLDALDKDNFDSIFAGVQYFRSHLTGLSTAQKDSASKAFMTFFFATISYHNDVIWEDYDFIARFHDPAARGSPDMQAYLSALRRNGLDLYTFGRLYYIDQQPEYLFRNFGSHVSPAVRFYLALRSEELAVGFSDSDSLLIPFKTVGARAIRWERYLGQYPGSVLSDFANYYFELYLHTFLTGLRLSPVFDPEGNLRPELSTVYHDFASRHDGTHAGWLVREFYVILKEAGFRWSPKVRDFYLRRGIRNMHTAQIPFR